MFHGRLAHQIASLRRWSSIGVAAAMLACGGAAVARANEACLSAPTPACIVDVYAAGADLPLHAVRSLPEAQFAVTKVITALLALDEIDIAEAVARRELAASAGARLQDRASPIAVARFLASVRAGAPDFTWLDGLGDPDGPLAALYDSSTGRFRHADRATAAYWQVGHALLAALAEEHDVATAVAVPQEARAAFRRAPTWQGVDSGMERWTPRTIVASYGWEALAWFRVTLGDAEGSRGALHRIRAARATDNEIRLWWRLGEPGIAEVRARTSGDPFVLAVHVEQAIAATMAAGDMAEALRLIADAWPSALERPHRGFVNTHHARRLVRATAASGARAEAMSRADALRNIVHSAVPSENETYWVEAGAALNDIGEHRAALALLNEELAWRPGSDAARCAPSTDRPAPVVRRGVSDLHGLAAEYVRAGAPDIATCLLDAIRVPLTVSSRAVEDRRSTNFLRELGLPGEAARELVRRDATSRDLQWRVLSRPGDVPQWQGAMIAEGDDLRRIEAMLAFLSTRPVPSRVGPLLWAAGQAARRGEAAWAEARLNEVLALLPELERPFMEACRVMQTARRLRREDIADAAFHLAVRATRTETQAIRGAILVDMAACRAGRIPPG